MNMPRKNRRVMLAVLLSSGVIGAACPSVAFAEALQGASSPSDTPPAEVAGSESTEIVVTAQKREERVQDVPAAVSVLSTASLATNNQRSEEHTSELQSLMRISYAVFCLKKKKKHKS